MRAVVLVLLGVVAINAEAEADPLLLHHTGVGHTVAGVYNAHVPGVHHVAGVYNAHVPGVHAGVTHVAGIPPAPAVNHVAGVYSHPYHYNVMYGKREAEPEAEPYTMGQVYAGLPVANAIATGHPHNVGVITNMVSPVHHSVHHPYVGFGFYG